MGRDYDNTNRARAKRETSARIINETEAIIGLQPLSELTLADVADAADVSVQTVIRHFGGRDGLLVAVAENVEERVAEERSGVEPGDVEGAVDNVLRHYEAEGDLVLRLLSEEANSAFAAEAVATGRAFHRDWVERAFAPLVSPEERQRQLDALMVATDIYTWRLLRRDHDRSLADVRRVVLDLVRASLIQTSPGGSA